MKILFIFIGIAALVCIAAGLYCGCCIKYMIQQENRQFRELAMEERLLGLDDDPTRYRDTV